MDRRFVQFVKKAPGFYRLVPELGGPFWGSKHANRVLSAGLTHRRPLPIRIGKGVTRETTGRVWR